MRKKLLALLMCATMVLGTGVTAFADDTQDVVDKIAATNKNSGNPKNFIEKEVAANGVNGKVKDSVTFTYTTVNGTKASTSVDLGYAVKTYTPVVLNSDGDAATKVDAVVYGSVNYTASTTSSGATVTANISDIAKHYATTTGTSYAVVLTDCPAATVADSEAAKTADVVATYYVSADQTTVTSTSLITGTNYVELKDSSVTFLKANSKILSGTVVSDWGKVYANVGYIDADDASAMNEALYEGVKNEKFTSNAFAVKFNVYVQETGNYMKSATVPGITDANGDAVKCHAIYDNFQNFAGGTFSLDYDLFTNSTLKSAKSIAVYKFTGYTSEYSDLFSEPVKGFIDLGSAAIGKTVDFDNVTSLSGVYVFDEGSEEATTDATETTTTANAGISDSNVSPKTGDATPIAALAVVMMGACGAMVVASKKRA